MSSRAECGLATLGVRSCAPCSSPSRLSWVSIVRPIGGLADLGGESGAALPHAAVGQGVGPLVAGVTGVALDP